MDDICDLAVDPNEAKTLIADIDEVLTTGGFQVKKWTSNVTLDSKEYSEEIVLGGETHTEKVLGTATAGPMKLTKRPILSKLGNFWPQLGQSATQREDQMDDFVCRDDHT